jgi:hypothetical protein
MFQTKVVVKIKTHLMFNIFFSKNRAIYEKWKNMVQPDGPDDNTSHALCVLDN